MPAPSGYDVGLQHSSVNNGVAVGFLLDEEGDAPFVEEQAVVASLDVTTAGVASVASYGLGAVVYRLRIALRPDVLTRDQHPAMEAPAQLRARILEFAARTDGNVVLQLADRNRRVAFLEAVTFESGPGLHGLVARLVLADLGTG